MTSNDILSENSPIFMMEPLPNCRSICARALVRATAFSSAMILRFRLRDEYATDSIAPKCHLRGTPFPESIRRLRNAARRYITRSSRTAIEPVFDELYSEDFTYLSNHYNIAAMNAFAALADPTRRRIVEILAERELAAGEIARRFDMTAPAVSQHLKILRTAELVRVRNDAQRACTRSSRAASPISTRGSRAIAASGTIASTDSSATSERRDDRHRRLRRNPTRRNAARMIRRTRTGIPRVVCARKRDYRSRSNARSLALGAGTSIMPSRFATATDASLRRSMSAMMR